MFTEWCSSWCDLHFLYFGIKIQNSCPLIEALFSIVNIICWQQLTSASSPLLSLLICFSLYLFCPDNGKDWGWEEKGMTEDEMVGWHHWLHGHEFGWTPGVGDGQGGLTCCSAWGCKESDTTEWLNWTELMNKSVNFFATFHVERMTMYSHLTESKSS